MAAKWLPRVLVGLLLGWGAVRVVEGHWPRPDRCTYEDRCPFLLMTSKCTAHSEGYARATLRTIHSAQREFRERDVDRNGVADYWSADIAGLYLNVGPSSEWPKLIEISVAAADMAPTRDLSQATVLSPKAGYGFLALRHAAESRPSPNRWAVAAVPVYPQAASCILVTDERGTVYHAAQVKVGIPTTFPSDAELARDWRPVQSRSQGPLGDLPLILLFGGISITALLAALACRTWPQSLTVGLFAVAAMPLLALLVHPWISWRLLRPATQRLAGPQADLFALVGVGVLLSPFAAGLSIVLCLLALSAGPWA